MSRTEDFDNATWSDPDFEALSPDATLLYIWSWTNPRCGMAGMYKVSHRAMTESKVSLEQLPVALDELAKAGFAFYEDSVLWVRSRVKRLRSKSPQMARGVAKDLLHIDSEHPLKVRFLQTYGAQPWLRDALNGTYPEPTGNLSEKPIPKPNSHNLSGTSPEVPRSGTGTGQGSSSSDKTKLPGDFPKELEPHLEVVHRVLSDLAARQRGARAVHRLSLASVLLARQRKPLVRAAHDCAAYWDGRGNGLKDVVAAYRNWLDRTEDLAAIELLGDDDGGRVVPMTSSKNAKYDRAVGL